MKKGQEYYFLNPENFGLWPGCIVGIPKAEVRPLTRQQKALEQKVLRRYFGRWSVEIIKSGPRRRAKPVGKRAGG